MVKSTLQLTFYLNCKSKIVDKERQLVVDKISIADELKTADSILLILFV